MISSSILLFALQLFLFYFIIPHINAMALNLIKSLYEKKLSYIIFIIFLKKN